jgi:hypothetical protein
LTLIGTVAADLSPRAYRHAAEVLSGLDAIGRAMSPRRMR